MDDTKKCPYCERIVPFSARICTNPDCDTAKRMVAQDVEMENEDVMKAISGLMREGKDRETAIRIITKDYYFWRVENKGTRKGWAEQLDILY